MSGSTLNERKNISQSRKREEMASEPGFRRDETMYHCKMESILKNHHIFLSVPTSVTGQIPRADKAAHPPI